MGDPVCVDEGVEPGEAVPEPVCVCVAGCVEEGVIV